MLENRQEKIEPESKKWSDESGKIKSQITNFKRIKNQETRLINKLKNSKQKTLNVEH